MYINCDNNHLPASKTISERYSKEFVFPEKLGQGKVIYSDTEWSSAPIFEYEGNVFIVAGWFVYKGERNDFPLLAKDILSEGGEAVNNVEAGSFIIYWWDGKVARIIVDPMGLSSHYIDCLADNLKIAPSVKVLFSENVHRLNNDMVSVLTKKNHLFGNYTLYKGIERLDPGSVYSVNGVKKYFEIANSIEDDFSYLGNEIGILGNNWNKTEKILPLSSGLDSRFILANTRFEYGFTYGPDNSPEINITSQFSSEFEHYYSFDFCKEPIAQYEPEVLAEMSFGVINPIPRLLTNYLHVKETFPKANAFFEGYLGDVFQRGTFITFKGVLGELFKIFPWVYKLKGIDELFILKRRYKELSDKEFWILLKDYKEKTQGLALNGYQKVTYYEFLYGRGGRYAVFGSNILAAQVFTVVSPFTHKKIFSALIKQNFSEAVSYKTMKSLWSRVKGKYSARKVESGYSPSSYSLLIPFIQIIYRLMFHFVPSRANYGIQLSRTQTNKAK
mgnify:FL=1